MPVSPSGVSRISAFHFRTCQSLDEIWIFQVGPGTFKYWRAERSETTKTPSTMQACSFFSNPFLEFCFSTPLFLPPYCCTSSCKYLTLWKFQSIALEPEILWKRWFARAFRKHFFFCYAIFTWIWTCKTHDLTDYQLAVGGFLQAITLMWWPQFLH